jgi:two-component system response regulator MprA
MLIPGIDAVVRTWSLTLHSATTRVPRILVVEDDPILRQTIAEALDDDGYAVAAAADAFAALELVRESPPDLAIVDLMLPIMSGEQFCTALRSIDALAQLPIIVVSAARYAEAVGARIGATATIKKPFDLFELTERVRTLLGR